ncbi:hypothetical protein GSI_08028 [Ganoderma sinense ZZ0214-1]|uniref:Uncharacterized protein n=1 Tax=Ganoderma sinense ZZ0214-1 TaxID=1077348 RepID=A0A2G8S7T7_9APHY|nr:hypothetical protein GSI_08028 [Ganoderma sinense ZZ0214-1]
MSHAVYGFAHAVTAPPRHTSTVPPCQIAGHFRNFEFMTTTPDWRAAPWNLPADAHLYPLRLAHTLLRTLSNIAPTVT